MSLSLFPLEITYIKPQDDVNLRDDMRAQNTGNLKEVRHEGRSRVL